AVVKVINTGVGAGIYWEVGSSATIDTTTSFEGNIVALTSITLNHGATIGCGRALAENGAVTMNNNTINATDCIGTAGSGIGSNGFNGGFDVTGTVVTVLPFSEVMEPGSLGLLGGALGLMTLTRWRRQRVHQRP